jgi:hypothetical protein
MSQTQYNPYTLPRIARQVFTKSFESEEHPGAILTLSLRKMDGPDHALMTDKWIEAENMYKTGQHELCIDEKPLEFPGLDADEASRLPTSVLQNAASLEVMQAGDNKQTLEFFVGICYRDNSMWNQINRFALEVNQGKAQNPEAEKPEDLIVTGNSSEAWPAEVVTQS